MKENTDIVPRSARPPLPAPTPTVSTEQRPWGSWTVLYEAEGIKVKLIEVRPGHRLSLQYHHYRSELWVCVGGRANAVIGDRTLELALHDTAVIPAGEIHRLGNSGRDSVFIVETQQGEVLSEEDIVRLEDDYHRIPKTSSR